MCFIFKVQLNHMRRLWIVTVIYLFVVINSGAQTIIAATINQDDPRLMKAVNFLTDYINLFHTKQPVDYSKYWSKADVASGRLPDDMVHSISSDGATYRFSTHPVIFYARAYSDHIHLKTNITYASQDTVTLFAITNHYVFFDAETGKPFFKSELEKNKHKYTTHINRNITYHFPRTHRFNKKVSDAMISKLRQIEQQWALKPVPLHYYFADDRIAYGTMRGLDYNFNMDEPSPSGISDDATRTIFCQGLGEGYLHEVLHIYFDPLFPDAALRHSLIYYLAGGIGHDFNWMVQRMATYLKEHPETDLTNVEGLVTSDRMIHADHTAAGVLLYKIDQQEGVGGLRRMMQYRSLDEALEQEFKITRAAKDEFLKQAIMVMAEQTKDKSDRNRRSGAFYSGPGCIK